MLRLVALLTALTCLSASAYERAIILSDSLADEGRIYTLSDNTFPPEPYYAGRFSDGPTWPEYAFEHRENYAYGGAMSGYDNTLEDEFGELVANTGLLGQVDQYIAAHPKDESLENTVFYIAIGGNDLLSLSESSSDEDEGIKVINNIIDNIKLAAQRLEEVGATHVTLIGLPDLAVIPASKPLTPAERRFSTWLSDRFNKELFRLAKRKDMTFVDMDAFTEDLIEKHGKYGFTNTTDACVDIVAETMCDNPEEYLFWDDIHPTTRVHEKFAKFAK